MQRLFPSQVKGDLGNVLGQELKKGFGLNVVVERTCEMEFMGRQMWG